jgi:hypothetical protein
LIVFHHKIGCKFPALLTSIKVVVGLLLLLLLPNSGSGNNKLL